MIAAPAIALPATLPQKYDDRRIGREKMILVTPACRSPVMLMLPITIASNAPIRGT